jgi:hypothetical protein
MTIASPLSRKATLVKLAVSQWSGSKIDKKVTAETNERYHADEDAGQYRKRLVLKEALEEITQAESKIRATFETYTKPWARGMGILPNAVHAEFSRKIRELTREHDEAANRFERKYASHVAEMRTKLNGMFNEADYPDPENIRARFSVSITPYPVPDVGDFRSDVLDKNTVEDIKREMQEASEQMLQDIMKDNVKQISEVVGHMSSKLREYGERELSDKKSGKRTFFLDSLVDNVRDLAKLLPAFNLTNDAKLDAVITRINKELTVEDAKVLRENPEARVVVQKSAEEILKDVESLLG